MVNDTLTSGGIHFTGLGSGTDFDAITEKLLEVEGVRKQRLELWRSTWESKIKAFEELGTKMTELKTSLKKIDTPAEFVKKTVSTTDSDNLTATAGADALEGTHTLLVAGLAANEVRLGGTFYSSESSTITSNGGQFVYTYNGATVTVDVASNTTLEGFVNLITRDSDNPGVRAEVVKITDSAYGFRLIGLDQGDDKSITIEGSTTLTGYTSNAVPRKQLAANAYFYVDGVIYSRDSNRITDVITGVDMTLKKAEAKNINISISQDKDTIKENIKDFVSKVNEIRTALKELTKVDTTASKDKGSLLTGNYGLQMIESQIKDVTSIAGKGFLAYDADTKQGDYYSTLAQLGILTEADQGSVNNGLLVIDEEKLDEALDTNLDAVADLFSAYYEGVSDSDKFIYGSSVTGTTQAGAYDVKYSISGGVLQSGATIGGYPADYDSVTKELTATDGPAKGLSVRLTDLSDVTDYKGTVRLKLGKVGEMTELLDTLTNKNTGTLHVLEENYQDIIDNIDTKITFETRRLSQMENTLKMKWARLETTLTKYNSIMTQLNSQISQLSSSS